MKKTFCDLCETEIIDSNAVSAVSGITITKNKLWSPALVIQILVGDGSKEKNGDFCKYCVFDAIAEIDNRPELNKGGLR